MRAVFDWKLASRSVQLGKRTFIMGVVNVTPDSFSDGGMYFDPERAIEHALQLLAEGADIVDIGGESTRPGAIVNAGDGGPPETTKASHSPKTTRPETALSEKEELERVVPVISEIKKKKPDALISADTYKAAVARAAVQAGAEIVNDVSGFRWDAQMRKTLAELKCGAVLMHSRGRPEDWRTLPSPSDIVTLVKRELREWASAAMTAGIKRERIVLDPGFGFGKRMEENYPLLKRLGELDGLHHPLLVGVSRKSFVGRALARENGDAPVSERLFGTLAAETAAVLKGAHIVRTHNVKACRDAMRIADLAVS
jgi:dihydropteroate synthase